MIVSLKGAYLAISPSSVTIEVHGVGYSVAIPQSTYNEIKAHAEGRLIIFHRFTQTGEQSLYGFFSQEEIDMFNDLLPVPGVGPSASLSVLSGMSVAEAQSAIAGGDQKKLETIKGIGKKSAAQIILTLKSKYKSVSPTTGVQMVLSPLRNDAIEGLTRLGIKKDLAEKCVDHVLSEFPDAELSDVIQKSLKHTSK